MEIHLTAGLQGEPDEAFVTFWLWFCSGFCWISGGFVFITVDFKKVYLIILCLLRDIRINSTFRNTMT